MDPAVTIADFGRTDGPAWLAVDDVVMGGVSSSRLSPTGRGTAVFEGNLSLENGGGFASVRIAPGPLDLSSCAGVEIRVRGDGKRYQLRLRSEDRFAGLAYKADFAGGEGDGEDDGWQEVRLPFASFQPTFHGRIPEGVEPLAVDRIRQVALLIAERQAGPFRLEVAWIRAYRERPEARRPGPGTISTT